ncbi:MAG: hypothetical protein ACXVGR_07865 [Mycobacteriaceae bacterium]
MPNYLPGRGWIAIVAINALITFFGLSYIFFPMGTVVQDGNHTTGMLEVPRELWGSYVVVSAVAMLVIAVTSYRVGRPWAWAALLYEFLFLLAVASIEPDPVVPTIFAIILSIVLWRARRRAGRLALSQRASAAGLS